MNNRRNILNRIKQLRHFNAPIWLIKNEQLDLALLRAFKRRAFATNDDAMAYHEQMLNKHVRPLMDGARYLNLPDGDL